MKPLKRKLAYSLALLVLLFTAQLASAFYDASLGRWLTRDPLGEPGFEAPRRRMGNPLGDGPNKYAFVGQNPISKLDALGLAPVPEDAEECFGAHPLYPDDPACDKYGAKKYLGASLSCFCKCPLLRDPWSIYVRGCLSCMDGKGVPVEDAHAACYESADKNYTRPTAMLAACFCSCKK